MTTATATEQPRGIILDVLRPASGADCTLGGITAHADRVTVVGVIDATRRGPQGWPNTAPEPLPERSRPHAADDRQPPVYLVIRDVCGSRVMHLVPAATGVPTSRYAPGGNYATTSDSRLTRLTGGMYGALAVHDRDEHR